MGNITEKTINRAISGEHAAFNEIYLAYKGGLRSYITSHINDKSQAEDVLQNTFVAVFKNIGQLKNPEGLKSWLYKIAYNECMTVNKTIKRESERYTPISAFADEDGSECEFADDSLELPEDFAANTELQELLTKTLNSLPKAQRDCLVLYYYQQKSIAEIAEILDITENAVKLRKKNALAKLKRKLEKYRGSYNFALAPMSLFIGKLVSTGKVKSAYTGAAVVRSATAGVTAACMAGMMSVAAVGYFGYNQNDNNYDDNTDDSSYVETLDDSDEGWTNFDLQNYVMSVFRGDDFQSESASLTLIPCGSYIDQGEEFEEQGLGDLTLPQEYKDKYHITEKEYKEMFDRTYPVKSLIDEDSQEYRFLRLDSMQYRDNSVRVVYEPYLSKIENFTEYDPGFLAQVPQMTVNCGLSDEYTVNGTLDVKDGLVIMEFDGISEPEKFGEMISGNKDNLSEKVLAVRGEDIDYLLNEFGYSLWHGLFEVKLEGYETSLTDDSFLRLPTVQTYHSYGYDEFADPIGLSWIFPGGKWATGYSAGLESNLFNPTDGALILHDGGVVNICAMKPCSTPFGYINDSENKDRVKKLNLMPSAITYGYYFQDDILYVSGYSADTNEKKVSQFVWVPADKVSGTLTLSDNLSYADVTRFKDCNFDRVIIGNNSQAFYDYLISRAASNINVGKHNDGDYYADEYALLEVNTAKNLLAHLENYEQYSASGDIETDIANALPYYDENGDWIDYNEELEVADETEFTEFDDVEEYEDHFFETY